jgi:integrase
MDSWVSRWYDWVAADAELPGVWRRRDGGFRIRGRVKCPKTGRMHEINRALPDVNRADKAYRVLQSEIDALRQRLVAHALPTFADYAATVFERKVRRGQAGEPRRGVIVSGAGREKWAKVLTLRLIPAFGAMPIDEVRRGPVQHWLDGIPIAKGRRLRSGAVFDAVGYQGRTVNTWLRVLRTILREASREFEIPMPHLDDLDLPEPPPYTEEAPNSLRPEDVPRFLAAMRAFYPQHYAMTLLGIVTGLRPSSMRPLRRRGPDADIKWDESLLLVRRSQTRGDEVMEATKTGQRQAIVLPLNLVEVLRWHVDHLPEGVMTESDLLVPARRSRAAGASAEPAGFRSRSCLDKPFADVARRIGLRYRVSPKAMRRTFQDLARAANVHDLVTRAISGHATATMQRHYSTVANAEVQTSLARVIDLALHNCSESSGVAGGVDSAPASSEALDGAETSESTQSCGAGEGIRTLDVNLGKVALYH